MVGRLSLDDVNAPLFTVGQVAEMLDVQAAFLRRLDQFGVVMPARSAGNQRRYSRHQIDQVSEACALIDDGLSLAGIRRVFALQARVEELETQLASERARYRQAARAPGRRRAD